MKKGWLCIFFSNCRKLYPVPLQLGAKLTYPFYMRYRKFQADDLFDGKCFLSKKLVLITDAAGTVIDVVAPEDAGEEVEIYSGIISPAFINTHCHIELSHLKNIIPEKTGLVDFVVQVVAQKNFKKEEVLEAIKKAETEMLQNGINNLFTKAQK